jgi:hypothetical protein
MRRTRNPVYGSPVPSVRIRPCPPSCRFQLAAKRVLRRVGAVRLFLAVVEQDGEVAYQIAVFGNKPTWMPEAFKDFQRELVANNSELWDFEGCWVGHREFAYDAPLRPGQSAVVIACPTLLAQTAEHEAQKAAFAYRASLRIEDALLDA